MQGCTDGAEQSVCRGTTGVDDNGDHVNYLFVELTLQSSLADTRHIGAGTNTVTESVTIVMQATIL